MFKIKIIRSLDFLLSLKNNYIIIFQNYIVHSNLLGLDQNSILKPFYPY